MITEIGIVAGEIWHFLDEHSEVTFTQLSSGLERNRDLLFMSLGWLAREGYIVVIKEGNDYKIYLRK